MSENLYDIAVIGGGASGMMAALSAAKTAPGLRIAVLERLNRVGKKLMATGNGRCNLTNTRASEKDYHGSVAFMRFAMSMFPPEKVMERFRELGVWPKEEEGGRVYPMSDQASSVLDTLRLSMEEAGIEEICDFEACELARTKLGYRVSAKDGRQIVARRVICAAGGAASPSLGGSASGYRLMESCGHESTARFPALVQLKANPEYTRPLKGIKYSGDIDLIVGDKVRRTETGEILFTEYGLSGIAVMQVSRIAAQALSQKRPQPVYACLHLVPMNREEAYGLLKKRRGMLSGRTLENFLTGLVNKRVGQMMIKWTTGLSLSETSGALTDAHLDALAESLTGWMIEITGTQGLEQAQVTAGGVRTQDINPETMESMLADGLYLTGELLDVDGDCGGFNLQWAWASGMLAGESCARSLTGEKQPAGRRDKPVFENRRPEKAPAKATYERRTPPERSKSSVRQGRPAKKDEYRSDDRRDLRPSKGMRKPHD